MTPQRAAELTRQAQATLRANDRGGYTVPTAGLYPFQWDWDAAVTALGWITFDEPRAWEEFRWLLKGQWNGGAQDGFHSAHRVPPARRQLFSGPRGVGPRTPVAAHLEHQPAAAARHDAALDVASCK